MRSHFASGNAEILETIQSQAEYIDLPSGGMLFQQSELSDDVYFVLSGRLRAVIENETGEKKILGEIGRGETIGNWRCLPASRDPHRSSRCGTRPSSR